MWTTLAHWVLRYRILLMIGLLAATAFMGYHARKLQLGYEFSKAIPTDDPKYQEYLSFKAQFGEDGNVLVIGVNDEAFFTSPHFDAYRQMLDSIKTIKGVEGLISVPTAINLEKNEADEKLKAGSIFPEGPLSDSALQAGAATFFNLPFYRGLLHNPDTRAYLAGATINKQILASKDRTRVVNEIIAFTDTYTARTGIKCHLSGLPLIRTQVADRIKNEMNYFLVGSLGLAVIALLLFFRSISATLMSLAVVLMGVVWVMGTMVLLGYKISLLTALAPPLIIVIGIPNCIYFLNKYHMAWEAPPTPPAGGEISLLKISTKGETGSVDGALPLGDDAAVLLPPGGGTEGGRDRKYNALVQMIGKMGVVTLFCNIAAAVGFAVFALTASELLKEFGAVAGINIMMLFIISLIFIPAVLSFLPPPHERHTRYLSNRFLENLLVRISYWVLRRRKSVYAVTGALLVFAIAGIFQLRSVGYIVDDLPKTDRIFTDLKWFEANFGGVMPLEIVVDTRRKNGVTRNLQTVEKMDHLSAYIARQPEMARPLSLVEGLKFAKQAYYDGDSMSYITPNDFDMAFLAPYLRGQAGTDSAGQLGKLTKSFVDSTKQRARLSVNMADVGTERLPIIIDSLRAEAYEIFDTSKYDITFTGSSVTFLEGSRFIINGLRDSIFWAFLLIALCMLYLFRNFRILLCSLIPNIIPLFVTAGIMGWAGVALKPSTVLVFSVALGIAIDVTIRFLVNYKQELPEHHHNVLSTTVSTIRHTGISIIYTSLVLVAGFVIFMFSGFGGTFSLGWLTSFTLLIATFTNLVFLPALMLDFLGKREKDTKPAT
ncbi:MAG TPA: efflux RND transporter permease subunit [Phnomibacter sp.]|nr:efflux RND transporter permease subunit [Phnomibacter sp.]